MKRYGRPASIVTDRLPSYRAAMKVIGNEGGQETRRWLNNRAEHSHQPFRRREGAMARFRDSKTLQIIHLRPCLDPQPFQPPTPSQSPRHFQTRPSRRPGRVASTCSLIVLDCRFFGSSLISLTMPSTEPVCLAYETGTGYRRVPSCRCGAPFQQLLLGLRLAALFRGSRLLLETRYPALAPCLDENFKRPRPPVSIWRGE